MADAKASEFFVGYFPKAPPGIARVVRAAVVVLLILSPLVAGVLTLAQNAPVPSEWPDEMKTLTGRVVFDPYPRLEVVESAAGGRVRHVLLVAAGKHGLLDPADYCGIDEARPAPDPQREALIRELRALSGANAKLSGTILRRGEHEMLEVTRVEPGANASAAQNQNVAPAPPAGGQSTPPVPGTTRVTLVGEIVDPKCYFGAMKPGEGKTHKACATRCIAGGITPLLVVRTLAGDAHCYIVVGSDGKPANRLVEGLAGEAVRVVGDIAPLGASGFSAGPIGEYEVVRVEVGGVNRL